MDTGCAISLMIFMGVMTTIGSVNPFSHPSRPLFLMLLYQIIAVTINAPNDWNDHTVLMEDGFSRFAQRQLVRKGELLGIQEVAWGTNEMVALIASEDFYWAMAQGEVISIVLPGNGFVYAPICEGQWAGDAHILVDGEQVGTIELEYGSSSELIREERRSIWQRLTGR